MVRLTGYNVSLVNGADLKLGKMYELLGKENLALGDIIDIIYDYDEGIAVRYVGQN
ncbi:MAG: hypothetical protein FWC47_11855 [Oscillospiraceae bacterium]|nr:hypothetical protein [Oscillospiraceae bacterium]